MALFRAIGFGSKSDVRTLKADLLRATHAASIDPNKQALLTIVQSSHNHEDRRLIMQHLQKCLSEVAAQWRRIFLGIEVLNALLSRGSADLVAETAAGSHFDLVQSLALLEVFQYSSDRRVQDLLRRKAREVRSAWLARQKEFADEDVHDNRPRRLADGWVIVGHSDDTTDDSGDDKNAVRSPSVCRPKPSRRTLPARRSITQEDSTTDGESSRSSSPSSSPNSPMPRCDISGATTRSQPTSEQLRSGASDSAEAVDDVSQESGDSDDSGCDDQDPEEDNEEKQRVRKVREERSSNGPGTEAESESESCCDSETDSESEYEYETTSESEDDSDGEDDEDDDEELDDEDEDESDDDEGEDEDDEDGEEEDRQEEMGGVVRVILPTEDLLLIGDAVNAKEGPRVASDQVAAEPSPDEFDPFDPFVISATCHTGDCQFTQPELDLLSIALSTPQTDAFTGQIPQAKRTSSGGISETLSHRYHESVAASLLD